MVEAAVLVFFPLLMVFAAWSDLLTMKISNWISVALVVGFFVLSLLVGAGWETVLLHVSCGLAVLAISFALFCLGQVGGGDAKLASAVALWFGWGHILDYALLFSLLGGVLTLAILLARTMPLPKLLLRQHWILRLHDHRTRIPYGLALAGAGLLVYPETLVWLRAASA